MKNPRWSSRVLIRYALFQIPSLALLILILILAREWLNLQTWFFWGFIILWVAKDALLFPFVWRAYDREGPKDVHSLVGTEGIVEERLDPSGYIRVHGELWQAEVMGEAPPIEKGEAVWVRGIRGLTLLVQPMEGPSRK